MRHVAVLSLVAGCYTYAAYSSRSGTHQGAYERAHAHAEQVGDRELVAALEQLGTSKDYNEGTNMLVKCMDSRAQVERWRRQTEAGDLLTKQSILAQASSSSYVLREEAVYDGNHLEEPERAWLEWNRLCVDTCQNVVTAQWTFAALPRDQALAKPYLAACQTSVAAAETAQHLGVDRDRLSGIETEVAYVEKQVGVSCFIEAARELEHADKMLEKAPAGEHKTALHDRAAAIHSQHAAELARATAFNHDPRVVKLETADARVMHQIDLVKDAGRMTGDYQSTHAENRERVHQDLEVEHQENYDKLTALARAAGVACSGAAVK